MYLCMGVRVRVCVSVYLSVEPQTVLNDWHRLLPIGPPHGNEGNTLFTWIVLRVSRLYQH